MFRNYLVTALRNIVRHKLYSVINIAGLAVGLACLIFIALFARDELSWDKWVPGSDNLYRVTNTMVMPGTPPTDLATTSYPLASLMQDKLPEVTAATHLFTTPITIQVGDRRFLQDMNEVDPNFFQVLQFPLLSGDRAALLSAPESIVLSQSVARKFFGENNPLGQTVQISRANCGSENVACESTPATLRVTGIIRDLPHNTQINGDVFIPLDSPVDRFGQVMRTRWLTTAGYSYVRLAPGSNPDGVLAKLNPLMDREVVLSGAMKFNARASQVMQVHLTRFSDVHLSSAKELGNMVPSGSWATLVGLGLIGLVILSAACFNFTNLATAWAGARAREISLRKCMGASRSQVMVQFLGETVMMALIAFSLALAIVEILLPVYCEFLDRPIAFGYLADWQFLCLIAGIAVAVGLVSGLYPAFVLSRFRPATVLRGGSGQSVGSGRLRSVLVVLQFTVSIALAIGTAVVFSQINFVRSQELGFRRDNIVVINTFRRMTTSARDSFADALRNYPGVAGVAMSGDVPFSSRINNTSVEVPGEPEKATVDRLAISPAFVNVYDMRLVAGRNFSDSHGVDIRSDTDERDLAIRSVMINEAAARSLGFKAREAVGKVLRVGSGDVRVVGVLADAWFNGARQPVRPMLFAYDKADVPLLSVRLSGGSMPAALTFIDQTWRRYSPSAAIPRFFLSDSFARLYRNDERQGDLFAIFVGVAILIACLGLFGLAAFSAGRRTREIGIRKVFGARTRDVVLLLLWQFSIPVLLANLIAWPIAWYYLHGWLQGFAYRITLSPIYFLASGAVALLIAWATILVHALRVARANPVHALRAE